MAGNNVLTSSSLCHVSNKSDDLAICLYILISMTTHDECCPLSLKVRL